jgi:hypothetical protein
VRDDDLRSSCFASLDVLCAKFGEDIPYQEGLDAGFPFRGRRVRFLSYEAGDPLVSNGLSLCSIHHRAFDQDLVGISPDYGIRVAEQLLEDEDGPMLELLRHPRDRDLRSRAKSMATRPGAPRAPLRPLPRDVMEPTHRASVRVFAA